ncbi:MAG: hypothetical protein IT324_27925 [Anaerolineae bacterium]|nr:hypothetical protein [Anaerolineae bacterium]
MASETEFSIVDRLGIDKLRLLLDIAAELASYTAGEQVSVADLAFDDRVAEQEIGRGRVRDGLLLFQAHGLLALDDAGKTLQPTQALIDWARQDTDTKHQQLSALLQPRDEQPETRAESTPEPTSRPALSRFGRGAGRQPIRIMNNAKSDEELLAEIEPAPESVSPIIQPSTVSTGSQPNSANLLASSVRRPSPAEQTSAPPELPTARSRWGSTRTNGTTPNATALRRPGMTQPAEPTPPSKPSASYAESKSAAGIVNLPTFFRLLDELNARADRLRQAGLTDDPNIHIDVLQLIQKIQENG